MLSFFVAGRPQPEAKKQINRRTGAVYPRDPDGSKRNWMENVRMCARRAMHKRNVERIPAKAGVSVNYHFYFNRAKSNKDDEMVIKPDSSRLAEAIDDALEGVCYDNDMQINRRFGGDKDYTTDGQAEGAMIEIWETLR